MNKKAFLFQQIKSLLPYGSFVLVFICIQALYIGVFSKYAVTDSGLFITSGVGLAALLFAAASPVSIFSYRYSLKEEEFYRQAPIPKNRLALIRIAIEIAFFLIAIFAAMIIGLIGLGLAKYSKYNTGYTQVSLGDFILSFLFIAISSICQILISCFFAYSCNNKKTTLYSLFFGNAFASLVIPLLCLYLDLFAKTHIEFEQLAIMPTGLGIYTGLFSLLSSTPFYNTFLRVINIALPIIFAGISAYVIWKDREPSAEFAGKTSPRTLIPGIVYHASFTVVLLYISSAIFLSQIFLIFIVYLFILAAYYFANASRTKSMRVNKFDFIFMISNIIGTFLISAILSAIF